MSKISILVVDSGSTDGTAEIARNHLIENARGIEWRVESVDLPGKSIAVNTALDIINTEIFAMLDADAVLQPDALKLLVRWFQDSDIGGVCGRLDASKGAPDFSYRSRFNTLRIGESLMGSTPIFEGSVCAFRMSSIGSAKISPNINADDSQLAMLVRRNGFRAIMDPELRFTEPDSTNRNQRRRSVRRAQGLVRALLANRDLATFKRGQGRIHAHALFFHVMMPWTLLLSFSSLLASFIVDPFPSLGVGAKTHLISVAILLVVILSKTGRGFLRGASVLLESHVLMLLGVRLNVWETDRG